MTPSNATPSSNEPVLRTLAPLLRQLGKCVRTWVEAKHLFPRNIIMSAALEGLVTDLHRQAEALDVDRPLLVIMLMGGTGVGKSSLLNALAGGAVAKASFSRPTTRDPVVYYHESVKPERFDLALRICHLASHDSHLPPLLSFPVCVRAVGLPHQQRPRCFRAGA